MNWITALVVMAAQVEPYEGKLAQHLRTPVNATIESKKLSYELEICAADVLTIFGTPTALRSGVEGVVIAASNPAISDYMASVTITRTGEGSRVQLRVRGKGLDDRIEERLRGCM